MKLSPAGCPALPVFLALPGNRQGVRRDFLGDGAACGDIGARPYSDRGDEVGVAADESAVADGAAEFLESVIVGGDGAAAEIDACA